LKSYGSDAKYKDKNGKEGKISFLELELVDGEELYEFAARKNFSPEICRYFFKQILMGVNYMHS